MRQKPVFRWVGLVCGPVRGGPQVKIAGLILLVALLTTFNPAWAIAKPLRILALGTSLTQGYNLPPGTDFTAVLEAALKRAGFDAIVVNAGVSGDTSADGLARLDWALAEPYDAAIVEFGSNDALRGLGVAQTKANVDAVIGKLKAKGLAVLLTGMKAPRNLGKDYAAAFDAIYPALAKKHDVLFYPFFLDGVAADLKLNQADGIHPNEAGTQVIVKRMLPYVEKLIAQVKAKQAATTVN
ncbi:MAG: arylesterase [Alphaproteobacteria bacterium]|nr:arylesterase [Alphaproteobacteria bacterium]